jgi:predicted RNA-binding protein with PUA-like domain
MTVAEPGDFSRKASVSRKYWLMKSEPESFSFDDLMASPGATTCWDGVRNYQARNFMRDDMKKEDFVLFYHSSCEEPGVVGVAEVSREAYPDPSAWDPKSRYHDPRSSPDAPVWFMVDITCQRPFRRPVTLQALKNTPALKNMKVVQKGQRLSVQPVTQEEFEKVCEMGMRDG